MRVAGNRVSQMADFYKKELSHLYNQQETEELLFRVFEHYLGYNRHSFKSASGDFLNQSDLIKIYDAGKRLSMGEPLQYVLGKAWFYRFPFKVSRSVLIPRPETEELVELIFRENGSAHGTILDIGTGSGCIPVSLKKLMPACKVYACDISAEALALAESNARSLQTEVIFFHHDILSEKPLPEVFDIIVSNPPYIKKSESLQLHRNVRDHEPHLALFVEDDDDIVFYKRIIEHCRQWLKPEGKLYFELNPLTAEQVKAFASETGMFRSVSLKSDMSGNVRFLLAEKN